MKFEKNSKYLTIAVYVLICASVVILFAMICFNFNEVSETFKKINAIFKPIIYALVMAFIFYPVDKFFYRIFGFTEAKKPHPKLRKTLSLVFTYLIVLSAITGMVAVIFPQVASSYNDIVSNAPKYLDNAQRWIEKKLDSLPFLDFVIDNPSASAELDVKDAVPWEYISRPAFTINQMSENKLFLKIKELEKDGISVDIIEMLKNMLQGAYEMLGSIVPQIWSFIGNIITEIKNIAIGLVMSVYILASRKYLIALSKKLVKALLPEKAVTRVMRIGKIANTTFVEFINTKILDGIIMGLLFFIVLSVSGMPYALLISVMMGIMNLIPFVGPFIGAVTGTLIILIFAPAKMLLFVILALALQCIDCYLIEPRVLGDRLGFPVVFVIISVIVMGGLAGIAGMFLGVPFTAVIYALLREWVNRRIAEKDITK